VNCTDFLAKLTDFFDGQIEPDLLVEVKEHLGTCHHCEVVVNTTRQTIDIYRDQQTYEFPEDLRGRLHSAIMARCSQSKEAAEAKARLHDELIRTSSTRSSSTRSS
jgi:anti-sigma factor RsiW